MCEHNINYFLSVREKTSGKDYLKYIGTLSYDIVTNKLEIIMDPKCYEYFEENINNLYNLKSYMCIFNRDRICPLLFFITELFTLIKNREE